jgi:hypothetical protein
MIDPGIARTAGLALLLLAAGAGCKRKQDMGAAAVTPLAQQGGARPTGCAECERYGWTTVKRSFCNPQLSGCTELAGADRALCEQMVACVRRTGCAHDENGDVQPCYCGDVPDDQCLGGGARGACKKEIEAAASSDKPMTVGTRFADTSFPVARAAYLIRCDVAVCKGVCTF